MQRLVLTALLAAALTAGPSLFAQHVVSSGGGHVFVSTGSGTVQFNHCCALGMFGPSVPLGTVPVEATGIRSGIDGGAPRAFPVTRDDIRHNHFRHDGQHNRNRRFYGNSYPYYYSPYPYYGYYDTSTNVDANPSANEANYEQPASDEGPGMTVFERRRNYDLIGDRQGQDSRYGEHYTDSREQRSAPADEERPAASQTSNEASATFPTLLIFKDGSHREITNYALMGNSIYDLSVKPGQGRMRILLADLDIPATIAANDQRGIDFKLPKGSSQ